MLRPGPSPREQSPCWGSPGSYRRQVRAEGEFSVGLGAPSCLWSGLAGFGCCEPTKRAGKVCGMESLAPWDVLQHSLDLAATESRGPSLHMEQAPQIVRASTCPLEEPSCTG